MVKYRFYLDGRVCRPNYTDRMALDTAIEGDNIFFRDKLSEPLKFLRSDYNYIISQPINHRFEVLIDESLDCGETWQRFHEGFFYITDANEIDRDHRKITMPIKTYDQYTEILDGLEREEDLIKMGVARTSVTMDKRPVIQVYIPGDDVITSIVGGSYWEQAATSELDVYKIMDDYKFLLSNFLREIRITGINGAPSSANGLYVGETFYTSPTGGLGYAGTLVNPENPDYRIFYSQLYIGGNVPGTNSDFDVQLIRNSDNAILYHYHSPIGSHESEDFEMNNTTNPAFPGKLKAELITYRFYERYLMDVDYYNGNPTWPIPEDDIAGEHYNYRRIYTYNVNNTGRISYRLSDEPTQWGMNPEGKYYLPPDDNENYFPVARSRWGYTSIWFLYSPLTELVEPAGRKSYDMRDTHLLSDVIKALVKKIDESYEHEGLPEYSRFLYDINPLNGKDYRNLITPKSNALLGEYDRPAEKAPITLKQVFDMLRETCKLYWFVDPDRKLRIEHISYFRKGGSYTPNHVVSVDLTNVIITLTGRTLANITSVYKYRKDKMPERIQFAWVDDVSTGFIGEPIVLRSPFVDKGKVEQVSIGAFNPDIDFMLLNPEGSSKDGFALFGAELVSGLYKLPYVQMFVNGVNTTMQNGYWSFPFIQENYYGYDLPAGEVDINGNTYNNLPVPLRMIEQEGVKFPTCKKIDVVGLVKTYLGNGEIEKMSLNLQSRTYTIDLNHEG